MKKALLALAVLLSLPCRAGELDGISPSTQFYVRVPLGPATSASDRRPSFGLAFKSAHDSQTLMFDSRLADSAIRLYQSEVAAGIEAKWLIVGAVARGAGVAIGPRSKSESNEQQQQNQQKTQQQQQQQQQPPSQGPCTC